MDQEGSCRYDIFISNQEGLFFSGLLCTCDEVVSRNRNAARHFDRKSTYVEVVQPYTKSTGLSWVSWWQEVLQALDCGSLLLRCPEPRSALPLRPAVGGFPRASAPQVSVAGIPDPRDQGLEGFRSLWCDPAAHSACEPAGACAEVLGPRCCRWHLWLGWRSSYLRNPVWPETFGGPCWSHSRPVSLETSPVDEPVFISSLFWHIPRPKPSPLWGEKRQKPWL